MMRARAPLLALALVLLGATAVRAETATAPVTYLAGGSVYADVGSLAGLRVGDTLAVMRAGAPVAMLRVAYLSSKHVACDTVWTRAPLAVGDAIRYTPRAVEPVVRAAAPGAPPATPATARRPGAQRLRGRLGARWLSVDGAGSTFRQPSLDVRLDGTGSGGGHVDLALDMRSRRTTRSFTGSALQTEQVARVYRAAMTVRSLDSRWRMTLGRQTSPLLASVSVFDGALFESATARRTFGLFSGTQPDPLQYRFSPDVVQSGGFLEWHAAPLATRRWSLATGGVTSQQLGVSNRDFLFAQGNWYSRGLSVSAAQEVDVNTGWKRGLGEPVLSPTSTFATARVPVHAAIGVSAGFDNRRNVRLYRDRLTPETEFDDAYRQGAWVGSDVAITKRMRISGDVRANAGGSSNSHAWSVSSDLRPPLPLRPALRARYSAFTATGLDNQLLSLGLGLDPAALSHVELGGGTRRTHASLAPGSDDREQWESMDLDLALGRRWYANVSGERDHGGTGGQTRQFQAGLSWRF